MNAVLEHRRRLMEMGKSEQWVLIRDITLGGDVITPTAYDSTTQEYTVDSFPSWASAAIDTNFRVVLVDDFTDMTNVPIPYGNNGNYLSIKKTDSTHFVITQGTPKNISTWTLANYRDYTFVCIVEPSEFENLRGIPLRLEIENTSSYLSRYSSAYRINGREGYNQGGTMYATDCQSLGYDTSRKLKGYVDLEFILSDSELTATTIKVNKQTCITCNESGVLTNKESSNLLGDVSANLWGKISTSGVYIGGTGIARPDCRIKLYKKV